MVLIRIQHSCWTIIINFRNAKISQHFIKGLPIMFKDNSPMMRVLLLNEHMSIKPTHFGDGKNADTAKAASCNGQDLALSNVGAQNSLAVTLQTIESNVGSSDVAFQRAAGEVGLAARRLQETVLNQLILDSAIVAPLAPASGCHSGSP